MSVFAFELPGVAADKLRRTEEPLGLPQRANQLGCRWHWLFRRFAFPSMNRLVVVVAGSIARVECLRRAGVIDARWSIHRESLSGHCSSPAISFHVPRPLQWSKEIL